MPRSRATAIALAGAAACLILFALLATVVVTGRTLAFNDVIRGAVHSLANPALTSVVRTVSLLGSVAVITALTLAAAIALAALRRTKDAIVLVGTIAAVMALNSTLKLIFHQVRPHAYFGDILDTYSFPSGHSAYSCCFYFTVAALVAAQQTKSLSLRALTFGIAAIIVAAVGFSRVYLGVHWPVDVVGGYLVALFVISLSQALVPRSITRL